MKRALLIFSLGLGLPLSACLNTRPCSNDSECDAPGRCDKTLQFCVFDPPDSGNAGVGGGTATGGGGGGMTGGGGGTIDAGFPDAGSIDAGADDGGLTDAGSVDAGTMDAGTMDAGTMDAGTVDAGTVDAGTVDAGTVDAGTVDAGFDAGSPFCSAACFDPFECRPSLDGGSCVNAYVLVFAQPSPSQIFGAATSATNFVLTLRRLDGGTSGPPNIPFFIPTMTPSPSPTLQPSGTPGDYSAFVTLPSVTQSYQAFAGWDGGPFATVNFSVDRSQPTVTLQVASSFDGGAHLRDALLPMAIHSNKQLDAATVVLTLAGTDGGLTNQANLVACSTCTARGVPCTGFDLCARLDLSLPPMGGLTGAFRATVSATDTAGNAGGSTTNLAVTRMRWRAAVSGPATSVLAAPALDKRGNLFVGTQDSLTAGRLVSFTPGGELRFGVDVGAVQSVAVAETDVSGGMQELAYVNAIKGSTSSNLVMLTTDGGAPAYAAGEPTPCGDPLRRSFSAISLFDAGTGTGTLHEVAAVMVFNPSSAFANDPGVLCRFGPRSGASKSTEDGAIQPAPDGGVAVLSPANIVVQGNKAYFQRTDKTIGYIDLSPFSSGGSSAGYAAAGFPTGLAMGGGALVATWAGGSTQPISTYQLPGASSPIVNSSLAAWGTARPATLLSNAVIIGTNRSGGDWLLSMSQNGTGLGATSAVAEPADGGEVGATSVVVGTGQRIYAVGLTGSLFVYDAQANNGIGGQSPVWSGPLFTTGVDVVAHPTLDCNRTGSGPGRPGTLYVVSVSGLVSAVIVDSTQLDPNAPWPKWQRTASNAGNPDFALNPGCP